MQKGDFLFDDDYDDDDNEKEEDNDNYDEDYKDDHEHSHKDKHNDTHGDNNKDTQKDKKVIYIFVGDIFATLQTPVGAMKTICGSVVFRYLNRFV